MMNMDFVGKELMVYKLFIKFILIDKKAYTSILLNTNAMSFPFWILNQRIIDAMLVHNLKLFVEQFQIRIREVHGI